jgi:NAD(P)-dependent dehydrogenase (short-subunit alcohol dehydrogenase family)
MSEFKEKVAVITGGSSGFGNESAQLLAEAGAKVVLWDIAEAQGITLATTIVKNGGVAEFIKVDVRLASEISQAAAAVKEKYGKVDILVNSAGVHQYKTGNVVDTDEDEYDKVMDINVKGIFLASKYIIPLMKPNGGAIINLASAWGTVVSNRVPIYCASKAAVIHLSKAMALDHARDRIRTNAIGPGTCRTPMVENVIGENYQSFGFDSPDDMWESRRDAHPIGRLGTANDIANLIVFLASDKASWITGACIIIDGGFSIGKSFKGSKQAAS